MSVALLQNVLPHQFISAKVKIVEAVYFANILNQSCFDFFRHQKAVLLNEPHPLTALVQLSGSELKFIHLFVHSVNTEGGLAVRYSSQMLWRYRSDQRKSLDSKSARSRWVSKQNRDWMLVVWQEMFQVQREQMEGTLCPDPWRQGNRQCFLVEWKPTAHPKRWGCGQYDLICISTCVSKAQISYAILDLQWIKKLHGIPYK